MSTSTFSFDAADERDHSPYKPWLRTWIVVVLLAGGLLGSFEALWRSLGYRPNIPDTPQRWHYWRDQVYADDGRVIVMLGASRIQAAISVDTFQSRCPDYRVIQLAQYAGGSPIGTLRTFADDDAFHGTIICDAILPFLVRSRWDDQRELYENISFDVEDSRDPILLFLQDQLAIMNADANVKASVTELLQAGVLPEPDLVRARSDRSVEYDFRVVDDLATLRSRRTQGFRSRYERRDHPAPEDLDEDFAEIDRMIRRIHDRGGRVVFLRLPSSGEHLRLEEEFHAKDKFWDRFAASSSAVCIHFQDVPALSGFDCPDASHLDYRDAPRFTNALVNELIRTGVLRAE